ncbi:unnamed protein product, partial [Allacma fusca]
SSATSTNESIPPLLFFALDPTESEKYTLPAIGEVSLLWPKTRSLRVKCLSEYSIYWDSTVAIKKYELPVWYEHGISQNSEPILHSQDSKYLMEATFTITQTTVGYISCQSIHDPSLRSRISIYGQGGRNYINAKYPRAGKYQVKEVLDTCGTDYVLYSNMRSAQSSTFELLENNTWFTNFPQFGLFFRTPLIEHTNEIVKCVGADMSNIHLEIFKNFTTFIFATKTVLNVTTPTADTYSSGLFPQMTDICENPKSCIFYQCRNPFECDIKVVTSAGTNCMNLKIANLNNGMRVLGCPVVSGHLIEYFFNGTDRNPYWFPRDYSKKSLLQLTTPENQIFVLDEFATVTCIASVFMLSRRIIFALRYKNQSINYLRDPDENGNIDDGVAERSITIYVDEALNDVICISPWFTFDRWIRKEMPVEPKINKIPFVWIEVIKDGRKFNDSYWNITDMYKIHGPFQTTSIKCTATGFPTPNIIWVHKPLAEVLISTGKNFTHHWSFITFHNVNINITGTYTCKVINIHGEANATVTLIIEGVESNLELVITVVISCAIILILTFCFGAMWWKIHRQARNRDT